MPHLNTPHPPFEHPETREQYEERVIQSVMVHAERNLYPREEELPYHNVDHMRFVHSKVVEYGEYVRSHGEQPDMFSLRLAAILHDSNYRDDVSVVSNQLISRGVIAGPFDSKESYAGWIAGQLLESYGVEADTIQTVQKCIYATNVAVEPVTLEEKMLVRADLDNIAGPKATFIMNTLKIVKEAELLNGPKNPFERITFSCAILQDYINKDLCFGDFDRDVYYRTFKKPALANTARITEQNVRTTVSLLGKKALGILPSLGSR